MQWIGLEAPIGAVVLGARKGIGGAFVAVLESHPAIEYVYATSRQLRWVQEAARANVRRRHVDLLDEVSMAQLAQDVSEEEVPPRFVINCTGLLHSEDVDPEKSWREFDVDQMRAVFDVNTFGPAMAIKHLVPAIPRQEPAIFATLSARVGSIGDNRLGGWYSYRASKAAQNMLVRTASLEAKTRRPKLILVALHPGTVASELSEPFTKRLAAGHAVFTPEQSCAYLCSVLEGLTLSDSGGFFAWDGVAIPW